MSQQQLQSLAPRVAPTAAARRQVAAATGILVMGAGWIHLLAAADHRAHVQVAAFFVAVAALQLTWAAACVLHNVTRWLLFTGLVGNLGLVALWVVSRTIGVPLVPNVGAPVPVGIPDAAASGLELLAATGLVLILAIRSATLAAPVARRLVGCAAVLVCPLVVAAGVGGNAQQHDHGDSRGSRHGAPLLVTTSAWR